MNNHVDLSVIIVSFNTKDLLVRCLMSLGETIGKTDSWEVIVVDNASSDDSLAAVKALPTSLRNRLSLRVIALDENKGFAAANNVGIKEAHGTYVLLLNSDTEVRPHAIQTMHAFMEHHPEVGLATCRVDLPDGTIDPACHRGFPTPWAAFTYLVGLEKLFPRSVWFAGYHQGYKDMTSAHEIDSPSGAFFFVRRAAIDAVGLLDEDYFMYAEDLDWAYRMKSNGWKIWYVPTVSILHVKKQSGRSSGNPHLRRKIQRYFLTTMLLFYQKHYRRTYPFWMYWAVVLAIRLQLLFV